MADLPFITRAEADGGRFFDGRPPKVREIVAARDPVVLVSGPAGTGKTTSVLERLRACALKYPNSRILICRSVRKWLSQAALVTWENKVLLPSDLVPDRVRRETRSEYRFRTGTVAVVAGLDDPQQVMSAEYDIIYVNEATEISQPTKEALITRLRNGRMPFQQLLMDCNPSAPTHWLKKEADAGRLRHIETRHTDNPAYYDPQHGRWTKAGSAYMAILDTMTGTRRLRLRDGRWAQAEGVVYDGWDSTVHVVPRPSLPTSWVYFWAVDFGFTNPFVWQCWAIDDDGRLWLVAEIYLTRALVEDLAGRIAQASMHFPAPVAVVCDHDAEGRATLERHLGISTTAADKNVKEGIDAVAARLRVQPDGRPRLLVCSDAACHDPDPALVEAGFPVGLAQEMDSYVWHTDRQGHTFKDEPLKLHDHACLVAGTPVLTARGDIPIEQVRPGDRVLTRSGWRPVIDAGLTDFAAEVFAVDLSGGGRLIGTGDHPVWVPAATEFARLDALRYGDRLLSPAEVWPCCSLCLPSPNGWCGCGSGVSSTAVTRGQSSHRTGTTSAPDPATWRRAAPTSTATCGSRSTGRSRTGTRSTTGTAIRSTTPSATCNCSPPPSMTPSTRPSPPSGPGGGWPRGPIWSSGSWTGPPSGGGARPAASGTGSTPGPWPPASPISPSGATAAGGSTGRSRTSGTGPASARTPVSPLPGGRPGLMTWTEPARAGRPFVLIGTPKPATAPVAVLAVTRRPGKAAVFNLTVDGAPEFFAGGVLVHNCDCARYAVRWADAHYPSGGATAAGYSTGSTDPLNLSFRG